jgi:hypothetical protein
MGGWGGRGTSSGGVVGKGGGGRQSLRRQRLEATWAEGRGTILAGAAPTVGSQVFHCGEGEVNTNHVAKKNLF